VFGEAGGGEIEFHKASELTTDLRALGLAPTRGLAAEASTSHGVTLLISSISDAAPVEDCMREGLSRRSGDPGAT
jgi:hypothetical protein